MRANPEVRGVLFDLPQIIERAQPVRTGEALLPAVNAPITLELTLLRAAELTRAELAILGPPRPFLTLTVIQPRGLPSPSVGMCCLHPM